MGAWSAEPFGNDMAGDWSWELDDANSWDAVAAVFDAYLSADDSDEETGWIIVAAAETVAHGLGRPTQDDEYTESVAAYVARVGSPPDELVIRARTALDKVSAEGSLLAELWADSDETDAWRSAIAAIERALRH